MAKKGKKGKGPSYADPAYCVEVFGICNGAKLITPSGALITVVGMGEKDELLYGMYPGNYVMALGDVDGEPVRDWNELLDAGYRLERQYVREMVHIIDAKRVFDPKLPLEHDGATSSKNLEMTSKMLEGMISLSHVSSDQLNHLSMLSGKEKERRHRLLISEMPEAVLLPKIRDVLRDPYTGPDNVKKILRMNKTSELKENDVRSPHKESVLMQCKTAMFDSSIPTSPQKLNAQSASHLAKEFFGAQNEAYKKNPESRDEKAYEKFRWQSKCYFEKHYDPVQLPPLVQDYFAQNPVEPPPEKKGKGKKKGKKKK